MTLHTRLQRGAARAAAPVESIAAAVDDCLAAQEAALARLLETCADHTQRRAVPPSATAPRTSSSPTPGPGLHGESTAPPDRTAVLAELFAHESASQQALAVGRAAEREAAELRRTAELEADRLRLAEARNRVLRARFATLTRERREAARLALMQHKADETSGTDAAAASARETIHYTNAIVEARRQLDQRTQELAESQERLRQLQQYHLDQLSGYLRPAMSASDAVRTTENFLDPDTNMAVRSTVVDSLLEVNHVLRSLPMPRDGGQGADAALPCVDRVTTLWDRLAVQNYVVGRVNRLFTCMCPTAPPLTLLKDTNMM